MSASHSHSKEETGSIWTVLNRIIGIGLAGFTLFSVIFFINGGLGSLRPKVEAPKTAATPATPATPAAAAPSAPAAAAEATAAAPAAAGAPLEITIKPNATDPTGMKYDVTSFKSKAGQLIKLTFTNTHPTLPQPHNVCVGKLGSKGTILQLAMGAATMPDAMAKGFVPDSPDIIAHTKLLNPGQSETIEFTLPAAGEYPYICTFPGHGILMNGSITVE